MADNFVENRAEEIPFSSIIGELLSANLQQKPEKMKTFNKMYGVIALNIPDIEAAVTLIFAGGRLRIEPGILGKPDLIINSGSENIMSLNAITIKFGLPYYFNKEGMTVLKLLASKELKIKGMFAHPILLTRLTKIMSVM